VEKSGRYQEDEKGKERRKNAILRVYTGFPGPVQEFVRVRVFDFKLSLVGQHNRTALSVSFPARSMVSTHENILHFPSRFTRCIL